MQGSTNLFTVYIFVSCHVFFVRVSVEQISTVTTIQDSATRAAGGKLELEIGADDGREMQQELKSPNLRSNQTETKDNVDQVSKHFMVKL